MTYQECLDYLYSQLPVFHRVGSIALKKSLHNIIQLSEAFGNPHLLFKSVHIGGTNGKGSSSNMLAAVLQSAGYKTGLYTSPHLKEFTERIKINGQDLPPDYLIQFVLESKKLFEEIQPSFFEMTVALAFKYFAEQKVDIAIIEVGLGGRLDSTNIITPLISLITNISLDHQNILGDTLPEIATEKAGIIKSLVPVVVSKLQPEVKNVFEVKAGLEKAPLYFADTEFKINLKDGSGLGQVVTIHKNKEPYLPDLELSLAGQYQQFNLPGVLKVVELLQHQGFTITGANIRDGLKNIKELTGFKGRWQILNTNPLTICDTGHNEEGIKYLLKQINGLKAREIHFIIGLVKDKDVNKILKLLPAAYHYYFCQATIPRALPAGELKEMANQLGLMGLAYKDVNLALEAAKINAGPEDVIFIGGSTFVVAEIEGL